MGVQAIITYKLSSSGGGGGGGLGGTPPHYIHPCSSELAQQEAYGRGSLPIHNPVSESGNPHCMPDPLPQPLWESVALDNSGPA